MSEYVNLRIALPRDVHRLLKSVCHRKGDQTHLIVEGIKWAVKQEKDKQRILEQHGYKLQ